MKHRAPIAWVPWVAGLVLAGCASHPVPELTRPTSSSSASADPDTARAEFLQRWRDRAEAAMQSQHWADAAWAWEVVLTLSPDDRQARTQRATALAAADAAAAERAPRAAQARQRGDLETATRLYLEILALTPGNRAAADALREIEAQRTPRGMAGAARLTAPMRAHSRAATPQADTSDDEHAARNELEHASMLANQGDLEGAIGLLQPLAASRTADPAVRSQLAELYLRHADQLDAQGDRQAAIAALRQCLKLAPCRSRAAARLKTLRTAPGARSGSAPASAASTSRSAGAS